MEPLLEVVGNSSKSDWRVCCERPEPSTTGGFNLSSVCVGGFGTAELAPSSAPMSMPGTVGSVRRDLRPVAPGALAAKVGISGSFNVGVKPV